MAAISFGSSPRIGASALRWLASGRRIPAHHRLIVPCATPICLPNLLCDQPLCDSACPNLVVLCTHGPFSLLINESIPYRGYRRGKKEPSQFSRLRGSSAERRCNSCQKHEHGDNIHHAPRVCNIILDQHYCPCFGLSIYGVS